MSLVLMGDDAMADRPLGIPATSVVERALTLAADADAFTRGWLAIWRAGQHATLGDLAAAWRDLWLWLNLHPPNGHIADRLNDDGDRTAHRFRPRWARRGRLPARRGRAVAYAARLSAAVGHRGSGMAAMAAVRMAGPYPDRDHRYGR